MSARSFQRIALGTMLAMVGPGILHALDFPLDHHVRFTPETAILGHFSATKKPILTVKSGAIVRIDGGGGARARGGSGELSAESVDAWLKENGVPTSVADNVCLQETIRVLKETPHRLPPPPGSPR